MEPEHVVARSIFINRNQSNLVIPACHECNNRKSAGESDLRDWLIITVGVDGHRDIEKLMMNMGEAFSKGFSKIATAAAVERKLTLHRRKSGLHVPAYKVPFHEPQAMDLTLRFMARGLYFAQFRRPYLPSEPLSLSYIPEEEYDETIEFFQQYVPFRWGKPMGKDVFNWMPIIRSDAQDIVPILMAFFGKVLIVGWIGIAEDEEERKPSFDQLIRRKDGRGKGLKGIVDRRLVALPPDDLLGYLRWHEQQHE